MTKYQRPDELAAQFEGRLGSFLGGAGDVTVPSGTLLAGMSLMWNQKTSSSYDPMTGELLVTGTVTIKVTGLNAERN
jgi:hypothetical protein